MRTHHLQLQELCHHPMGGWEEYRWEPVIEGLPARFQQIAHRYPDRPAIVTQQGTLSYRQMEGMANRVASAIRERLPRRNSAVGLLTNLDANAFVAILGVLKSGHFYVAPDPHYPRQRLQDILRDAQVELVIADDDHYELACRLSKAVRPPIHVDELLRAGAADSGPIDMPSNASPDDIATVIYTSGSTGRPKGVVHTHRTMIAEIGRRANNYHFSVHDRLACFSSLGTLSSFWKGPGPLLVGACTCPFDIRRHGMDAAVDWLEASQSTIVSGREVLRYLMAEQPHRRFPTARLVTFAGDTIYRREIPQCMAQFPNALVGTGLASSETGGALLFFLDRDTPLDEPTVPLGFPVHGCQVYLRAEDGSEVADGEVGEIAVQSRYLASGYWQNPELTAARFLPVADLPDERIYLTGDLGRRRPDSCIVHAGRKDFQVKVRGHRVDTGEVEARLLELAGVREAVVVLQETPSGQPCLTAYIVPIDAAARSVSQIRRTLAGVLPEYMVPAAFVFMDGLPRTNTYKVNRRLLPRPEPVRPELDTPYAAPRTPVEELLAAIWADVLELDRVGIQDDFLELGGNSLAAGRIVGRVEAALHQGLPMQNLFAARTVAQMTLVITHQQLADLDAVELEAMLAEIQ